MQIQTLSNLISSEPLHQAHSPFTIQLWGNRLNWERAPSEQHCMFRVPHKRALQWLSLTSLPFMNSWWAKCDGWKCFPQLNMRFTKVTRLCCILATRVMTGNYPGFDLFRKSRNRHKLIVLTHQTYSISNKRWSFTTKVKRRRRKRPCSSATTRVHNLRDMRTAINRRLE